MSWGIPLCTQTNTKPTLGPNFNFFHEEFLAIFGYIMQESSVNIIRVGRTGHDSIQKTIQKTAHIPVESTIVTFVSGPFVPFKTSVFFFAPLSNSLQ